MRDRRNTNLSTSSTSSSDVPLTIAPATEYNEKQSYQDVEMQQEHAKEHDRPATMTRYLLIYRISSLLCIVLFVLIHSSFLTPGSSHWQVETILREGQSIHAPVNSTRPERIDLVDNAGRQRWTISIPEDADFPLADAQYNTICRPHDQAVSSQRSWLPKFHNQHCKASQPAFVDIAHAQAAGVLKSAETASDDICPKTLTFSVDANEASFGKTLLLLWLSYGIAMTERRTFFVDDSRWVYGNFSSYFPAAALKPTCKPPPPSHIVPCPVNARHGLISASTLRWSLQPRLDAMSSSWAKPFQTDRKVFNLMRIGYEALFSVAEEDKDYADSRISQLREEASSRRQPLVGMHIRRGDKHPLELQFSQDYLPLERYTDAAKQLFRGSKGNSTASIMLASDDPDLINNEELSLAASPLHLQKTQDRIQLATKAVLDRDSPSKPIREPGSAYVKHVDENIGWDGGFYSSLFFSLGKSDSSRKRARNHQAVMRRPSDDTMRMRELIGRAYLLDLEVLRHADGIVCAVSSAACRVLGVMMGWDAVEQGRWVNVDDGRPWSWSGSR